MIMEGRCHGGEGVPPLRVAGILPAVEGKMPATQAVHLPDNRAKEQA